MSEAALPIAIEARERAWAAHKRLDGINGSIDRLNTRVDGAERRLGDKVDGIDEKLDQVLLSLAESRGKQEAATGLLVSRRFWIGIMAMLLTSSVAVLLITVALRRHG